MKNRVKHFLFHNRYIFAAFFLPVLLVAIALAVTGIYPFGTQMIPVIDMYHQYVPFLSELQHKLQTGESLFYTWNGAAGCNFWNLLAYYCASPLNLLLVLFPAKALMEGVTTILLIKIGLAGAFMAIYLREVNNTCNVGTAAFATCYALCSYVMGYYWCIMWMDAVLLLPLVILGLTRIVKGKSPVLYVVTLALTVFCNYYISIMVCIFILFYFPVLYFSHTKGAGARACAQTTVHAVLCSFLAIAMAAVMLLPTWYAMQNAYYISSEMPDSWTFYNPVMDVLNQLMPNAQLTYREGMPNIYCGLLVVILVIFYVVSKTIRLRTKVLHLGLLAFLFLSLNINKLDFIWHGFHFPNQLPYRYSFVVCFLLVGMAYQAFVRLDHVKVSTIWAAMAGILAWLMIGQRFLTDKIDNVEVYFYLGAALLVAYTVLLVLYRKRLLNKRTFIWLITFVVAVEAGFYVPISFKKVGNTEREYYFENYQDVRDLVEEVDGEFARVELDDNFILNTPALYHYKGVSQFSSSLNSNATYTMEAIGLEGEPGKNRYNYNPTDPVTNAILNIKYLISKSSAIDDPDMDEMDQKGESILYRNRYALAMGYMTGQDIWSWDINLDNPFSVLDDYVRAATGDKVQGVFAGLEPTEERASNMSLEDNGEGAWITEAEDQDAESTVELEYTAEETQKYYVFVEAESARDITVYKDSGDEGIFIREDCGSVVNIGEVQEGENFQVEINYDAGSAGSVTCHVMSLDQEAWDDAYEIISRNLLEVESFSASSVKGKIKVDEYGVFVTSIPYEKGWTMKVDGKKRRIDQTVGEIFIATNLEKGTHQIQLDFRPPGLLAGLLITLLAIALLIVSRRVSPMIKRRVSMRRAKRQEPYGYLPVESGYSKEDRDS